MAPSPDAHCLSTTRDVGTPRPQQDPWRLAIVEDHLLQRIHAEQLITQQPDMHVVFSGESLPEFTDFLAGMGDPATPHLLVLDLIVDREGHADPDVVASLVRDGMKVVVFSAMTSPPLVQRMIHAGINGLISKRDSIADVIMALRTVLTGGRWVTPDLPPAIAAATPRPALSVQEERTLVLYASGLTLDAVATSMGVGSNTVKKYLQRVKRKYAAVGREAHSKIDLLREARIDGYSDVT